MNQFAIPNPTFPLLQIAVIFRAPVCMYANKYIHKYIHINCICELCFHLHRSHLHSDCTQIHIYQPFSLCVLLFCGGWKSNFLPKDDSRGPSPPGCSGGTDGSLCAVQMQRFAATDVTWCWAADGASGERVDVWQSTFKLEPPWKILALLSGTEGWIPLGNL